MAIQVGQTETWNPGGTYNADYKNNLTNTINELQKQIQDNPFDGELRKRNLSMIANMGSQAGQVMQQQANAPNEQLRQQYLSQVNQYAQNVAPYIQQLQDPNALRQIYDLAATRSRSRLASEYAARGLSGSGEYAAGLSSAYAQLGQQEQQDLERRQAQAAQLQQSIMGAYGQAQGQLYGQNLQQQQMALQQQQYQQQLAEQERQRNQNMWSSIGQIGLGAASLAVPFLAPAKNIYSGMSGLTDTNKGMFGGSGYNSQYLGNIGGTNNFSSYPSYLGANTNFGLSSFPGYNK